MPTKFQIFKQKFISNFIMPKEFRNIVVEKNLKLLLKISASLTTLSIINFIYNVLTKDTQAGSSLDYIIYYFTMSVLGIFVTILAFCFLKIKKISKAFYNIPLVINFLGLEVNCYLIFTYGTNPFNALIIFVCLATLVPLLFAFPPLYYIITMIIMGTLMTPKINDLFGIDSVYNALIYLFIMCSLAMSRWYYIISNMKHEATIMEHQKQIQQELEMASVVQKSFYQHNLNNVKDWNISYCNDSMINLSGDFFDFYVQKNKLDGLSIFDVSGHGLASGLVTMLVKNSMEEEFYENKDVELDFTMQRINHRIREEKGKIENYLTGIMLRFNDDKIEMVNAGHPNPIIYHAATGTCEYFNCDVKDRQGAIGLSNLDFNFTTLNIDLAKNDRIILYTDGVTEAKNFLNNEYGKEQFLASAQKHCNLNVDDQITALYNDIKGFIGTSPRTDDISIIILEKK